MADLLDECFDFVSGFEHDDVNDVSNLLPALRQVYELRQQHGEYGEHPDHTLSAWQEEASNDYTRKGYWEWVASEIRSAEGFNDA